MVKMIPNGTRYQGGPSDAEMQRRHNAASEAMKAQGIDCIIAQANDAILCQYVRWFAKARTTHHCVILFDKDKNLSMLGHGGAGTPAIGPMFGLKLKYNMALPVFNNNWIGNNLMSDQAVAIIKEGGYKKVGFVAKNLLSYGFCENLINSLPGVEFVDATDMIDQLIMVKSEEEIGFLKAAIEQHQRFAETVPSLIYVGRTERELGMDLYKLSCLSGSCEYLTNISMGSSKNGSTASNLQYQNKIIEEGDVINILFEVPSQAGYYPDFRRLWGVGYAAPEVIEAVAASAEMEDYLAARMKPGVSGKELFELGNDWLKSHGMPLETRMHGHGQGYGLVERPYIDAREPQVMKENMFISIHPKINYKGVSVAPGDNHLVTKDGAVRLTTFPRQVTIV